MVQRIARLRGGAYSTSGDVHVQGTYNGVQFVNGPVTTTIVDTLPSPGDLKPYNFDIAQFETTTDDTGQIPVVLTVTGSGVFYFGHFYMNYTGYATVQEPTNPNVPIDPNDPSTYIWVTIPPEEYFGKPNTITVESDGVSNLTKNGVTWNWRENVGTLLGDWKYPINAGDTVTFNFFVDPNNIVLIAQT